MAVYAIARIFPNPDPEREAEYKQKLNDLDHFQTSNPLFCFVNYSGTSQELSNLLGFTDGRIGYGIVMSLGYYYGYADKGMWEWLETKSN